jgi:hypothetical protein
MKIEDNHTRLSTSKQCELVEVSRSGLHYQPVTETEENLEVMCQMDEQYLTTSLCCRLPPFVPVKSRLLFSNHRAGPALSSLTYNIINTVTVSGKKVMSLSIESPGGGTWWRLKISTN